MDDITEVIQISKEIKIKWNNLSREHKKMSVERRIQKIIDIPLQDVKNIMDITPQDNHHIKLGV